MITADYMYFTLQGTANVIQACVERNVSTLVYTSTVDVVIGAEEIFNGDESLAIPRKFLFHGYPQTKYAAEVMVNEANGRTLAKGRLPPAASICPLFYPL